MITGYYCTNIFSEHAGRIALSATKNVMIVRKK